jgi:hypothetical protein
VTEFNVFAFESSYYKIYRRGINCEFFPRIITKFSFQYLIANIHARKNIQRNESAYNGPVLEGLIDKLMLLARFTVPH